MKLWLLKARPGHPAWEPWYDKAFAFVVRAKTAAAARDAIAKAEFGAGDEGTEVWLDESASTCVELTASGEEEIIVREFARA